MDFNIEYGGDEVDFDKVIEAIVKADPDVVALEEAEGNTSRVAAALGWPYHSVRSQLVSKLPLIDPPGANGLYEFVEFRPGEVAAIVNVHLPSDPYGPYDVRDGKTPDEVMELERTTRLAALQPRLDAVAGLIADWEIPTFILGDFNAPSHLDWTEATVGLRPHIKYPLAWPVSTALEAAGFRDTYRELHPDPVASPGLTWWAGRPLIDGYPDPTEPQDRIDIIYAAGPSTTAATWIVGEKDGPEVTIEVDPWGTDHRGVVADLLVRPAVAPLFVAAQPRLVTVGDPLVIRGHSPELDGVRLAIRPPLDSSGTPIAETPLPADGSGWSVDSSELPAGNYEAQILDADGGLLESAPFSVAAAGATASLVATQPENPAGAAIELTFSGAPGSRWDWIGFYPRGGDPNVDDYLYFVYTGSRVSGTVTVDESGEGEWPLAPGEYDVLLLLDDGYVELARTPITVTP
jgi:hypothetical protein